MLIAGIDKAAEHVMSVWEWETSANNGEAFANCYEFLDCPNLLVFSDTDSMEMQWVCVFLGKLLGRVATHQELIFGVVFHPLDSHLLISFGRNHLTFWNRRKDGYFERSDVVDDTRDVTCVAILESGDLAAGDSTGAVRIYSVNDDGEYFVSHQIEAAHSSAQGIIAAFLVNLQNNNLKAGHKNI